MKNNPQLIIILATIKNAGTLYIYTYNNKKQKLLSFVFYISLIDIYSEDCNCIINS